MNERLLASCLILCEPLEIFCTYANPPKCHLAQSDVKSTASEQNCFRSVWVKHIRLLYLYSFSFNHGVLHKA